MFFLVLAVVALVLVAILLKMQQQYLKGSRPTTPSFAASIASIQAFSVVGWVIMSYSIGHEYIQDGHEIIGWMQFAACFAFGAAFVFSVIGLVKVIRYNRRLRLLRVRR